MKKILLSLAVIVAVGGVVWGVTGAFYNDTETSQGNIFTAGSIDLKVDHLKQTYNGVDCKTCSVTLVSDTSNQVVSTTNGTDSVAFPHPAVDVSSPHPLWQNEAALAPAQWIWATDPTLAADTINDAEYTFEKKFQWNGTAVSVILNLALAADNGYKIILNGTTIVDKLSTEFNYGSAIALNVSEATAFEGAMVNGENTLQIVVRNKSLAGDPITQNPAGLLYNLNIHRNPAECAADSAFQNACRLWTEKNLGAGDTFFNFNDVKPGDLGTNVISLHVSSNDAYACFIVNNKDDQENSLLGPEIAAGDAVGFGNPNGFGELSNFLNVFTWGDTNGNGLYDGSETALGSGPLSSLSSIMSMDSVNGQFLTATTTKNIGLVWCAGTLATPVLNSPFVCNGSGMGNIAQSDSFSADLTAYAVQVRNNGSFSCANVNLPIRGQGGNAAGPVGVNLLSAGDFAIVAKTAITDATPASSVITGNVAINPAAGSAITGLSCTSVVPSGKVYSSGGYTGGLCAVTNPALALAVRSAMEAAYTNAEGRTGPNGTNLYGGIIGGQTFAPGLYKWTTGVTIPTDVTLSGGANDVWIFQVSGDLSIASTMKVKLDGGALAKNVFWQVGGPTGATLGTNSEFNGTILSATQVKLLTGAKLNGRALAQTQVTLDGNIVTKP